MTRKRTPGHLFFAVDAVTLGIELIIYSLSLAGPALILHSLSHLPVPALVVLALALWPVAAVTFMALVLVCKRLLAASVPQGRFLLTSRRVHRWILADRCMKIVIRSPFFGILHETSFLRLLLYRGMGARMPSNTLLGRGSRLPEPWAVSFGENVHVGDDAVVSGHKVERGVVTLEPVDIGDDVLIGAGSIVFPGVTIGSRSVIGANSVVVRGSVVGEGETWVGNPAKPVTVAHRFSKAAEQGTPSSKERAA